MASLNAVASVSRWRSDPPTSKTVACRLMFSRGVTCRRCDSCQQLNLGGLRSGGAQKYANAQFSIEGETTSAVESCCSCCRHAKMWGNGHRCHAARRILSRAPRDMPKGTRIVKTTKLPGTDPAGLRSPLGAAQAEKIDSEA